MGCILFILRDQILTTKLFDHYL